MVLRSSPAGTPTVSTVGAPTVMAATCCWLSRPAGRPGADGESGQRESRGEHDGGPRRARPADDVTEGEKQSEAAAPARAGEGGPAAQRQQPGGDDRDRQAQQ